MINKNYQYIPLIKAYADQMKNNSKLTKALQDNLCCNDYATVDGWPLMDWVYEYLCANFHEDRLKNFKYIIDNWFDWRAGEKDLVAIWYRELLWNGLYKINENIYPSRVKSYKRYETYEEVMDLYYPDTYEKIPEVS